MLVVGWLVGARVQQLVEIGEGLAVWRSLPWLTFNNCCTDLLPVLGRSFGVQTKAESLALLLLLIVLFTGGVGASACPAGSTALASEVSLIKASDALSTLTRCF